MATIYARKTNSGKIKYYGNLTINGKRYKKYLADDIKSAKLALSKLEYDLIFNQSQEVPKEEISLSKAVLSFLKEIEASGVSSHRVKTIKLKLYALENYSNISLLSELSVRIAKNYMQMRAKSRVINKYQSKFDNYCPTLSPKTYNQELQIFIRFYNHCIELGWTDLNPFLLVKPLKEKSKGERYYFRDNDLKKYFSLYPYYNDIITVMLYTGLRFTDTYTLSSDSISNGYFNLKIHKTNDYLKVPVPQSVMDVIKPRMCGILIFPEFQSERNRIKFRKDIQCIFSKDFVRKNNINLHTFRHTYAHNMLNKGVPKEVLQTLLGHRSIKTTEIYANWVRKEELEKWIQ